MTRPLALLRLARLTPVLVPGIVLHRAGLSALAAGDPGSADDLFERAALAYRRELRVERLARVRVHQAIARVRSGRVPDGDGVTTIAIERGLTALARIEALEPPFAVVDARELLASWGATEDTGGRSAAA